MSSAHWLSASAVAEPTLQIGFTATKLNAWAEASSTFELFSPFLPPPSQPSLPPLAPGMPSFPPEQPPPSHPPPSHPPPLRPPPSYPPPTSPPLPLLPPDGPLMPPVTPPIRSSNSKFEGNPTQIGANREHAAQEQVRPRVLSISALNLNPIIYTLILSFPLALPRHIFCTGPGQCAEPAGHDRLLPGSPQQ